MALSHSPAYEAFHGWLRSNRKTIAADKDKTVIYSGMTSGKVPLWKKLPDYAVTLETLFGVHPRWQSIETVLSELFIEIGKFPEAKLVPVRARRRRTVWDFACSATRERLVSVHEGQQIWKNLSANYVRNATGGVYIWDGEILKTYPDLLMAEIPVLMKNKKIDAGTRMKAEILAPRSKKMWAQYRSDTPKSRLLGR